MFEFTACWSYFDSSSLCRFKSKLNCFEKVAPF
ncbi:MAG TPA: hypothetical protein DDY89_08355 [Lysinibacillus sp.]|nr:hypothetical protein [Lysinibacillus sp.]